ncbi:hypothetical protein L204_102627 [Cryptococcus depauperatus]
MSMLFNVLAFSSSFTPSAAAGPKVISKIPTLAELQKSAESLGSSFASSLPSLPAYPGRSEPPEQLQKSGVAIQRKEQAQAGITPNFSPPSYSEKDPYTGSGGVGIQGGFRGKLKKKRSGWLKIQTGIPDESELERKPKMVKSRAYAESFHDSRSQYHNSQQVRQRPSWKDWIMCRTCR